MKQLEPERGPEGLVLPVRVMRQFPDIDSPVRIFDTDGDLEQFLRHSNLPYAVEAYVRFQNRRIV